MQKLRFALFAALVACSATAQVAPSVLKDALNGSTEQCLGHAFEMPGQAWHVDLTGGGISLSHQGLDVHAPTFEAVYGFSPRQLGMAQAEGEIQVIDHFVPTPVRILTAHGPETLMLSHGALVEAHLRALLESAGFELRSTSPLMYGREDHTMTLSRLDLAEIYKTKSLGHTAIPATALAEALAQQLANDGKSLKPKDLVMNMSFSMIPCRAMNIYRQTREAWAGATPPRRYTFNAFLNDVASANHLSASDVQRRLTRVPQNDPLRRTLADYATTTRSRGARFVAVASSGNFGLPYPTAPAAFADVVSAGMHSWQGKVVKDTNGAVWPDAADANVAGEWFTLSATQLSRFCAQGGTCITPDVMQSERYTEFAYRGTSFAAPSLSLFIALQQGHSRRCFGATGTGYSPIQKAPSTETTFDFTAAWDECQQ